MLILQRKPGESLYIGEEIKVTVLAVDGGRVRLAIDAPQDLSILRNELKTAMNTNQEAAVGSPPSAPLLDLIGKMVEEHRAPPGKET